MKADKNFNKKLDLVGDNKATGFIVGDKNESKAFIFGLFGAETNVTSAAGRSLDFALNSISVSAEMLLIADRESATDYKNAAVKMKASEYDLLIIAGIEGIETYLENKANARKSYLFVQGDVDRDTANELAE